MPIAHTTCTRRRLVLGSLMAGALAPVLVACASGTAAGTTGGTTAGTSAGGAATPKAATNAAVPTAAPAKQPATVAVLTHTGSEADAFKAMFEVFKTRRPEITIDYSVGTTGGANAAYNEKLVSLVASGDAPDVFKTAPFGFGQLAAGGAYLALDDYVKRDAAEVKPDDFFRSHYEGCKYLGKQYGLPQTGAPQALWINLDLWQREGLTMPTWDSTWADLLKAATAITKRDPSGAALQMGTGRPDWLSWIWSAGGDIYNAEGTKMLIDQPPAIEALTWLQDAVQKYHIAPDPQEQSDPTLTAFENGKLGTAFGNRGALGKYQSINGFTYDAAPLPKGPKGRVAFTAVGQTSIWSGSKVKDASWATLVFMCSTEAQKILIGDGGTAHPSRKSSTQQSWFKDFKPPRANSTQVNTVFSETLGRNEARAITPHPHEAQINQAILKNLNNLWSGAKPPREVAAAIMAETSSLMVK